MSIETVNGYVCHNCSDVALAKRNIDPAHPKDASGHATNPIDRAKENTDAAVSYGGSLVGMNKVHSIDSSVKAMHALDLRV